MPKNCTPRRRGPTPTHATITAVAAALLGLAAGVHAQAAADSAAEPALQLAQTEVERHFFINDGAEAVVLAASETGGERVVKGAPYCADAVNETVQWLPDGSGGVGNRIVQQRSTRLCRDGEGRTRQEVDAGDGRRFIYLRDPVTRENWVLDPERKTARRLGAPRDFGAEGSVDAAVWRDYGERMREWAREFADRVRPHAGAGAPVPAPPVPPAAPAGPVAPLPPLPVIITTAPATPAAGPNAAPELRREVRVIRTRPGADVQGDDWAVPPPAVSWRARSLAPRGAGTVVSLGSKEIEGLRANGERTTWVIEAGRLGNEKPIQITREVWTAPDLMLTLSSRDFDPRAGETSYRLKGLRRGEPDAALMRVPADYSKAVRTAPRASGPAG